jgi:ABC-type polysaccharide/polyol phosphate transport system ATPase subunit
MTEPVIQLTDVSKRFLLRLNRSASIKSKLIGLVNTRYREQIREFWALRDLNLRIEPGESVGIIGPNGSGKSTLFKLIAGIIPVTSGTIVTHGRIAPMIELGVGFHLELTGRENIFLNTSFYGISRTETASLIERIVEFAEIGEFIDSPLKNYSTGMVMRLGFAISIHTAPDILLVDEILAVGDQHFQQKCLKRMQRFREDGRTFVFVSHSLDQIVRMCDRSLLLWNGRVLADGPSAQTVQRYEELLAQTDSAGSILQHTTTTPSLP